jgi:hypothetical protein
MLQQAGFSTHMITRLAGILAAVLILLAPALWNGFPLLQYDTGGYFARWYEGTLEESRSTVYALFLHFLSRPNFCPVVVVQTLFTVWILRLVLRSHGLGERARVLPITVAALSILTALPWLTSQLITDIMAGLAVLALYLVVTRADTLVAWERVALMAFIAFAVGTHNATLAVLMLLLAAGLAISLLFDRKLVPLAGVARGAFALVLGASLLVAANYVVARRLAWTPGGIALLFGRMLNEGIAQRFLAEHCPDSRFKLCDHLSELPNDADVFFWGEGVFDRLGRFQGMNAEMATIVLESLADYPWEQIKGAVIATGRQLVMVNTGYGVNTEVWHTYGMIETYALQMLTAMMAAHQQHRDLNFPAINRVHVPVAYLAMLLLIGVIALASRHERFGRVKHLAVTVALALLANAFVCGALSNPHDRYGARMVWLAVLVLLLTPWTAAGAPVSEVRDTSRQTLKRTSETTKGQ